MTILLFLAQWAIRSSILILCGMGLVGLLRVKNAVLRLTVWSALLAGSVAIPALMLAAPTVPVMVMHSRPVLNPQAASVTPESLPSLPSLPEMTQAAGSSFDWARIAVAIYGAVALLLLLRVLVGAMLARRFLRDTLATDRTFRESSRVAAPMVLGVLRPVMVLPGDWRDWDQPKLDAVLAHERSHMRRHDPAAQMLSAIHRALLWISPASWFLHRLIVRTAEEASDDAALAATGDRTFYAEVLLGFMQRGVRRSNWLGVSMARYGRVDRRIHRVLNGRAFPAIARRTLAAILATVSVLAYLVATAGLSQAAPPAAHPSPGGHAGLASMPDNQAQGASTLGTVTATTVAVTAGVSGQLANAGCADGRPVKAGQLLATIESFPSPAGTAGQHPVYTQVRAPISGLAGFCKVDPGNLVHPGETLLTITRLHPIAIVFSIPEELVPRLRTLLAGGMSPAIEVFNRDGGTARLATGHISGIDNEIDPNTGTIGLKAVFENRDGALFPNELVIVRLLIGPRVPKRR